MSFGKVPVHALMSPLLSGMGHKSGKCLFHLLKGYLTWQGPNNLSSTWWQRPGYSELNWEHIGGHPRFYCFASLTEN